MEGSFKRVLGSSQNTCKGLCCEGQAKRSGTAGQSAFYLMVGGGFFAL